MIVPSFLFVYFMFVLRSPPCCLIAVLLVLFRFKCTYIHTYTPTYVHTYIHKHIHNTYIHTHTHTHTHHLENNRVVTEDILSWLLWVRKRDRARETPWVHDPNTASPHFADHTQEWEHWPPLQIFAALQFQYFNQTQWRMPRCVDAVGTVHAAPSVLTRAQFKVAHFFRIEGSLRFESKPVDMLPE